MHLTVYILLWYNIRNKLKKGDDYLKLDLAALKEILNYCAVPEDMYSLTGGLPSETYCIDCNHDCWEVFYSERGNKNEITRFDNEAEACAELLTRILNDSFYRSNRSDLLKRKRE